MSARRPNPVQWLGYSVGRTLPPELQGWVRNDLIGDAAVPRHLLRSMVPFLPIFLAFLLFPGELWLRGAMILLAVLLALFYSLAYMEPNRRRRLAAHGLSPDLQNPKKVAREERERRNYERWRPGR
ncbi:DUF5313 family protein [Rhodococcoides kroppenstedtii]|uniref:DUF5313 family protein n=1 Tax=Rhodococcoides kroppenstedtii TaxID=293050 RepID=UPI0028F017C5|nr:DUF5313 family protein [Rhodococcus kroppenstedtii]